MPMVMGIGAAIGAGEKRYRRVGHYLSVMPALVAASTSCLAVKQKTRMAGTLCAKTALRASCPAMTRDDRLRIFAVRH